MTGGERFALHPGDVIWSTDEENMAESELVVLSLGKKKAANLVLSLKHLPGRHDQSTHGNRARKKPDGPDMEAAAQKFLDGLPDWEKNWIRKQRTPINLVSSEVRTFLGSQGFSEEALKGQDRLLRSHGHTHATPEGQHAVDAEIRDVFFDDTSEVGGVFRALSALNNAAYDMWAASHDGEHEPMFRFGSMRGTTSFSLSSPLENFERESGPAIRATLPELQAAGYVLVVGPAGIAGASGESEYFLVQRPGAPAPHVIKTPGRYSRLEPAPQQESKDAVGGHHVPGTPFNWRHGWEPLNAQAARERGKPSSGGRDMPPVRVLDGRAEYIDAPAAWQKSADPEVRAATIWSDSYGGLNAIRTAMRNKRAGKDPLDGVDLKSDPWLRRYTQVALYDEQMTRPYSEGDLKNDIVRAADTIAAKVSDAPKHDGDLWRGMVVDDPNLFRVGDEFDQDLASWTSSEQAARTYATPRSVPGKPLDPNLRHPVIMNVRGVRAYDIGSSSVGNTQGGSELLTGGRYRVTGVEDAGDHLKVTVEGLA